MVTEAVEVEGVVVIVDDFENDGSCRSGGVSCGEDNGNIDAVAVKRVLAVVVVTFIGSIVVMPANGGISVMLDIIEDGVIGLEMVAVDPIIRWSVMLSIVPVEGLWLLNGKIGMLDDVDVVTTGEAMVDVSVGAE